MSEQNNQVVETPTNLEPIAPLTVAEASKIGGAMARLNEIRAITIQTPTITAEAEGLMEFVANSFLRHADEFLGCWFTIRQEYEPMVRGVAQIFSRVQSVQDQFRKIQEEKFKQTQEAREAKIVKLK